MVRIVAENVSEDALRKIYCEYMSMDSDFDDSDDCEVCSLPKLFHVDNSGEGIIGPCDKYTASEKNKAWSIFRQKIRPIRRWYNDILEKREEKKNNFLKGFTALTEAIMNGDKGIIDLQKYITENGDIELEPLESQKIMGIVKLILSHWSQLYSLCLLSL